MEDGTEPLSNSIASFLHSPSFASSGGAEEGDMNGVKPVMVGGRCRRRISRDGKSCRTLKLDTGGEAELGLMVGRGMDIEASREARRWRMVALLDSGNVGGGSGSPICINRIIPSSRLSVPFEAFSKTACTSETVSSMDWTASVRTLPISSLDLVGGTGGGDEDLADERDPARDRAFGGGRVRFSKGDFDVWGDVGGKERISRSALKR